MLSTLVRGCWHRLVHGALLVAIFTSHASLVRSASAEPPDYTSGNPQISLLPPEHDARDNYPIPSFFGSEAYLEPGYFFIGLDAPGGWVDEGVIYIVFEQDGTTDFAELVLGDEYENEITLEIRPLLDQVRIHVADDDA